MKEYAWPALRRSVNFNTMIYESCLVMKALVRNKYVKEDGEKKDRKRFQIDITRWKKRVKVRILSKNDGYEGSLWQEECGHEGVMRQDTEVSFRFS